MVNAKTMRAMRPTLDQIWKWLEQVVDPEIPVLSVVDLGIVRDLHWREEKAEPQLVVTITPTYSGCPATATIKEDIGTALRRKGILDLRIETQLSPAWTTDWLSKKGKEHLQKYGIAPPRSHGRAGAHPYSGNREVSDRAIECPRCGSKNTRMVSEFGSTPCKAFYICEVCREPFDYFKCH
jgi:ring-1,2-phenylacetyl-CoA epoxidase subunit PaaD